MNQKIIWGIRLRELLIVLGFYFLMATVYHVTLIINTLSFAQPEEPLFSLRSFSRELMDYGLKLLLTAPIWWLLFRGLYKLPLSKKLFVHLFTLPLFVFAWREVFYLLCRWLGFGYLQGYGQVWDVYIPALFYIVQFGIFHVYHYYHALQRQERLAAELKQLALQSEMTALKAQIQPHFLFNALNSISAALPAEQEHTRELIAKLADIFRHAMNTTQKEFIPLEEELSFIKNCLSLEQERFRDRLRVVFTVDDSLKGLAVPPMLLQPLVENAVKHGIGKSVEGGTVEIKIKREAGNARFEISDTGAGLNGTKLDGLFRKGIGLRNTQQRLQKLYNTGVTVQHHTPRGTCVAFTLPITSSP